MLLVKRNDCSVQVNQDAHYQNPELKQLNGIQPPFIIIIFLTGNYGSISFVKKAC